MFGVRISKCSLSVDSLRYRVKDLNWSEFSDVGQTKVHNFLKTGQCNQNRTLTKLLLNVTLLFYLWYGFYHTYRANSIQTCIIYIECLNMSVSFLFGNTCV